MDERIVRRVQDGDQEAFRALVVASHPRMSRTLDEMISIEVARNLVAALAEAGVDHVYEEVPTDHFDVLEHEAFFDLQESFLASQLHPTE